MNRNGPGRYDSEIQRSLATRGGHLSIGRGGYTLFYDNVRQSGYDSDTVKRAAIAASLPVIDSRTVPYELVAKLAVSGPMIAVSADPSPRPWRSFSYAPLDVVAAAYRAAGAEVFNSADNPEFVNLLAGRPLGPPGELVDFWLDHASAPCQKSAAHSGSRSRTSRTPKAWMRVPPNSNAAFVRKPARRNRQDT